MIHDLLEKGLISKKTHAVYDFEFVKALKAVPWQSWLSEPAPFRCRQQYLETFERWAQSTKLNTIIGIERFQSRHLICGTTQTFDEAYLKYPSRRLRFFRGEYAYHRRVVKDWKFIEDQPLAPGDYIIVSLPFCTTGREIPDWRSFLDEAYKLQIPVIVDCAYFGTCTGLTFDLDHLAIESVSFSLSKGLGLGDIRSGIRFSNCEDDLPICQQNRHEHTVLSAAKIGIYMMNLFSPDFIPNKYRDSQLRVCRYFGITPTPCMHLGVLDADSPEFAIDERYYRAGIRELVKAEKQGKLSYANADSVL